MMSGAYPDTSQDVSGEVAAQVPAALADVAQGQADAARFISAHGAQVIGGHSPVREAPPTVA